MKPSKSPILSNKDVRLLVFLWRFRLATFRTIHQLIYPSPNPRATHDRLKKLKNGGFIQMTLIPGTIHKVFCLEKKGFQYLESNVLPELRTKQFKPQSFYHDLLSSAVLLGNMTSSLQIPIRHLTEQEIKSVEIPLLTEHFPNGLSHHPDGIWIVSFDSERKAIALEVELTAKSSRMYEEYSSFYAGDNFFRHVLWVVRSIEHGNQILKASRLHGIPREGLHLFVLQKDFENMGWMSPIRNSHFKGYTMADVFSKVATQNDHSEGIPGVSGASPEGLQPVSTKALHPFLNFEFSLKDSNSCREIPASNFKQLYLYGP